MFRWNANFTIVLDNTGEFKFHYVQMEPSQKDSLKFVLKCLNSTMFRWNANGEAIWYSYHYSLNSTMFRWNLVQ